MSKINMKIFTFTELINEMSHLELIKASELLEKEIRLSEKAISEGYEVKA